MAQIKDSIWSGDFNGVNYNEHYGDVRGSNVRIDSLKIEDSLVVKVFTIYGDSLLPNYLLKFKNLRRLNIRDFKEINNVDILNQLPNLKELFFINSNFKAIPKKMVSLKIFWVENNWRSNSNKILINIEDFSGFKDMKNLKTLWLRNCNLTKFPLEIRYLTQLIELNLSGDNKIEYYSGLEYLINLELLTFSDLWKSKIPKEVAFLVNLKALDIGGAIGKINYKPLYELKKFEQLTSTLPEYLGDRSIRKLKKHLPNLWIGW